MKLKLGKLEECKPKNLMKEKFEESACKLKTSRNEKEEYHEIFELISKSLG